MDPEDYYEDENGSYEDNIPYDPEKALEADILEKQESGYFGSEFDN